jgi:hypothetical protein
LVVLATVSVPAILDEPPTYSFPVIPMPPLTVSAPEVVEDDNPSNYSVDIKNECSGNVKTWVLSPNDWMNAYVGSHYCITNTTSW